MTHASAMHRMAGSGFDRRSALSLGSALFGAIALLPGAAALSGCSGNQAGHRDHSTFVLTLLGLVIPGGETPGAGTIANMSFVLRAVDAGLMKTPADTLDKLADELDYRAGTRFVDLPQDRQARVIAEHDAAVFAQPIAFPSPWFTTKALILMAYFTSEAGASQELEYELVPGRLDPDVKVAANWRPLSNDWAGNSIKKAIAG